MPTLNQIVKTIGDLASTHKQIKSFYFGDLPDYLSRGTDNVYPSLYYDLTGANLESGLKTGMQDLEADKARQIAADAQALLNLR